MRQIKTSVPSSAAFHAEESALEIMRRIADASAAATCGDPGSELEESSIVLDQAIARSDLADRLRSAIEDAASRDAIALNALRIAICEFTLALRDEGTTPEGVLITLKSVIDRKSLPSFVFHGSERSSQSTLRENMST
ncbi:MAG TPA: hypothetical protein VKO87_11175, partial [Gemmatimonadaceae bacterium]|nr:hypothetical protein [Gemmatimonadaceae bacterium]